MLSKIIPGLRSLFSSRPSSRSKGKRSKSGWDIANKSRLTAGLHGKLNNQFSSDLWRVDGPTLRKIARYLVRNHAEASRYTDYFASKVLGPDGVSPCFSTPDVALNEDLTAVFQEWSLAVDPAGGMNWSMLQEVLCREMSVCGEAFCSWGIQDGRFVLSPFEPEQLEGGDVMGRMSSLPGGDSFGIVYDSNGRPSEYLVSFPDPSALGVKSLRSKMVSIPSSQVFHIFQKKRPTDTRGESPFASVAALIDNIREIDLAELIMLNMVSHMGLWLKTPKDVYDPEKNLKNVLSEKEEEDSDDLDDDEVIWEAGMVRSGPEEPQVLDVHRPSGEYLAMRTVLQEQIASALNMPYAVLSGNTRKSNYSSMRTEEMGQRPGWRRKQALFVGAFCRPFLRSWLLWAHLSGAVRIPVSMTVDEISMRTRFDLPVWAWVDPVAELQYYEGLMNSGFKSWGQCVAEMGNDPASFLKMVQEEQSLAASFGVKIPFPGYKEDIVQKAVEARENSSGNDLGLEGEDVESA